MVDRYTNDHYIPWAIDFLWILLFKITAEKQASGMKNKLNEIIQWIGAVFVIAGHSLNAIGPAAYPWNIIVFIIGTLLFLTWSIRVTNRPQMLVNVISLFIGITGIANALG